MFKKIINWFKPKCKHEWECVSLITDPRYPALMGMHRGGEPWYRCKKCNKEGGVFEIDDISVVIKSCLKK